MPCRTNTGGWRFVIGDSGGRPPPPPPRNLQAAVLDAHARRQAFEQPIGTETIEPRRPSAGAKAVLVGRLDQPATLDQAAKILLVQVGTEDGFHGFLQLEQREHLRHQLENHRTVLDQAAQLGDGAGQHTAVVAELGVPQLPQTAGGDAAIAASGTAVVDQPGLAEQFVALHHLFLIPGGAIQAKTQAHALVAARPFARTGRLAGSPGPQWRLDLLLQTAGTSMPPIFPRKILIPAAPGDAAALLARLGPEQRQVAD